MASSRHRETMSTYMQRSTLLRVKRYDLGTDCLIHGKPSWMMPDYVVAFSKRVLFDLAGAGVTHGRTRPSHCVGPSLSCRGHGTLQVSHLFPIELTYAKIGNSLLLKRYFREIAGVCIVFRTLGTQAKKQLSRKIILVETSHVPYFSIL